MVLYFYLQNGRVRRAAAVASRKKRIFDDSDSDSEVLLPFFQHASLNSRFHTFLVPSDLACLLFVTATPTFALNPMTVFCRLSFDPMTVFRRSSFTGRASGVEKEVHKENAQSSR